MASEGSSTHSHPQAQTELLIKPDSLAERFWTAVVFVTNLPPPSKTTPVLFPDRLKFYALFKQATLGTCKEPQPSVMQQIFRAKWQAWHALGDMSKDEAMSAYISKLRYHLHIFPPTPMRDNLLTKLAGVPVTLYVDYMSQQSRAVVWFCKLSRIPFEIKEIRIHKRPADYNQVNPHGSVPAISDNGFLVFEGSTIMRYLTETYTVPIHLYPRDPRIRSKVDGYIDWHHSNLRIGANNIVQSKVFKPVRKVPVNEHEVKIFEEILNTSLKSLEDIFLEKNSFVGGTEHFSIADLICFTELQQLELVEFPFETNYPKIFTFMENMRTVEFCSEVSSIFYKVASGLQWNAAKL